MNNRTFYNEVLTDHNRYPGHKEKLADANLVLEGVNPSCGDDIVLQLRVEDGRIAEGTFTGDGCAISQASVDIIRSSGRLQNAHKYRSHALSG